jgi:hypothetical protein
VEVVELLLLVVFRSCLYKFRTWWSGCYNKYYRLAYNICRWRWWWWLTINTWWTEDLEEVETVGLLEIQEIAGTSNTGGGLVVELGVLLVELVELLVALES